MCKCINKNKQKKKERNMRFTSSFCINITKHNQTDRTSRIPVTFPRENFGGGTFKDYFTEAAVGNHVACVPRKLNTRYIDI